MAGYIVKQIFLCQRIFIMLLKILGSFRLDYEYEYDIGYLEETELRKADRTVGVNCNIFSNISSGTA